MEKETQLLDISETAELLRLKESTIRSWILKRKIPFVRLGRRVFVRRAVCEELITKNEVAATAPVKPTFGLCPQGSPYAT